MAAVPNPVPPRVCPVCDGRSTAAFWTKGTLQLVKCSGCSMVYADPVAPDLAGGLFYENLANAFYLSPDKLQSDYASVRFERELRLFRRFCRGGRVLDVGCSTGAFLYQINRRWPKAYQVLGTDIVGAALEFAESQGVRVLRTSFLDYHPGNSALDAITFWAVLEHLADPKKFLAKAAELLKPGGYCFILVPNFRSLAVRIAGVKYRYLMMEHLNYFTPATLLKFVSTQPTFEVVHLTSMHFNPLVIWQDSRKPKERVPDQDRAQLLKHTTAWKQKSILRPVKFLYATLERLLGSMRLADNLALVLRKQ